MDTIQGQPGQTPAATGQGEIGQTPAGIVPPGMEQFVESEPPNTPPAAVGQGQAQGQPLIPTGQTQQPDPSVELLRLANQRQAEIYRLQRELEIRQASPPQQQIQAAPTGNPYNPTTQPEDWWRYEKESMADLAAQRAVGSITKLAETNMRASAEQQWQLAHPQIPIELVKQFGRVNGLGDSNLDAIYTLMTLPQQQAALAQQTAQTAFNQFRQPQTGATPVRGGSGAGGAQVGLSYAKLAQAYDQTNGKAYESWHPDVQKLFDQETSRRAAAER